MSDEKKDSIWAFVRGFSIASFILAIGFSIFGMFNTKCYSWPATIGIDLLWILYFTWVASGDLKREKDWHREVDEDKRRKLAWWIGFDLAFIVVWCANIVFDILFKVLHCP